MYAGQEEIQRIANYMANIQNLTIFGVAGISNSINIQPMILLENL